MAVIIIFNSLLKSMSPEVKPEVKHVSNVRVKLKWNEQFSYPWWKH